MTDDVTPIEGLEGRSPLRRIGHLVGRRNPSVVAVGGLRHQEGLHLDYLDLGGVVDDGVALVVDDRVEPHATCNLSDNGVVAMKSSGQLLLLSFTMSSA